MFPCNDPNHDHSGGDPGEGNPLAFIFAAQQEEVDRQRATAEVAGHEVSAALLTMDRDQLIAVRQIVGSVIGSSNPAVMAGYFTGRVVTLLDQKFGVCPTCNTKHDDPSELLAPLPEVPEHVQARRNLDKAVDTEPPWTPIGSKAEMTFFEIQIMKKYNLDDLRSAETGRLVGFVCVGCGQQYSTIADRQLKEPGVEGCSGCQQKAKFG